MAAPGAAAKPKPLRPFIPKRLADDRIIAEPEFSFATENSFSENLSNEWRDLRYDARLHTECVTQWVDKTRPAKQAAFDEHASLADTLSPHYVSAPSSVIGDERLTSDNSLEEEWRKREFDRAVSRLQTSFGLDLDEDNERRKIEQKVARYRKAFLRGFFEARVRRLQANKCLYDKLHVNVDFVKQKYRQLMYNCRPCYAKEPSREAPEGPVVEDELREDPEQPADEKPPADAAGISSVYSFEPERDNVMLQDVDEAPHLRGYGHDKRDKFDATVRLLNLDNWMSPDIREWIEERKRQELLEYDEEGEQLGVAGASADGAALSESGKAGAGNDLEYEQIRGANEPTTWLGPKTLNPKKERDFENFMKGGSVLDESASSEPAAAAAQNDGKVAAAAPPPAATDGRVSESDDSKTIVSDTPSQFCMKELIESQCKEYYKLWYSAHDTYNTTPFLEARLQRLMKEVLGKRQWAVYSSYLKKKSERQSEKEGENVNLSVE